MTELTQVLNDAAARLRALSPQQSFIVQAPAGSGKTELLTQRYLRLLATVEQPEQILAITFTRKAASEMRNRILQALARARAERPSKTHEAQTWELAQAALTADSNFGWQLETHPSRLRIQTIDALNASLSRRLPLLAGTGAAMEVADDIWPLYEAVCERLLQQLGDGSKESLLLETVLLHLANRVPSFVSMLCELLARRDHWLPLLITHRNDADLRGSIEHTLRAAIEHHLTLSHAAIPQVLRAELIALCVYAAGNKLRADPARANAEILRTCAALTVLPPTSADALPLWLELETHLCTAGGEFRKRLTVKEGFPAEDKATKQRMTDLLTRLCELPALRQALNDLKKLPAPKFTDSQWQVVAALLHLLPKAVAELMLEFQARSQVDYVELALRALRALGSIEQPTDTALALDERLQHILVDEFQDTSYTQMALLKLLTAGWSDGDGRSLFCVGDPMQSIYRFRQAEVGLFIELQQHGLPNLNLEPLRLQTNFRSTLPVVEWVNRCFPSVLPHSDDSELGAVKYSPSQPRPEVSSIGKVIVHTGIEQSSQAEAKDICELIKATLSESLEDRIAILVSGRSHVGPIANELKRAGIEFTAVDIERLQDRPLVQDLVSLTRALLHLGDRTAWLACLRAPWCGLSLADLHAIAAEDGEQAIWPLLNAEDVLNRLSSEGLQRVVCFNVIMKSALEDRGRYSLRDWIERCWLALAAPATLQNKTELDDAEAFFARLSQLEVAGDLEDIARLESQLGNLFATPRAEHARVEIMTIHKSKGLEFDVVILPSLHRSGGRDGNKLLRWTRLTGLNADGLVLAPPSAKGEDNDSIYQWLCELEKQRAQYERGRLLYVATTRAKRELHLFGSTTLEKSGELVSKPRAGTLLSLLWTQVETDFQQALQRHKTGAVSSEHTEQLPLKRLPLTWSAPAASPSVAAAPTLAIVNAEFERPEFEWVGEVGRHIGTAVHAELERMVKLPITQLQQWNAEHRRAALLLQLAELGVPEALRHTACERVIKAIANMVADRRGRWILGLDVQHQDAVAEIALSGVVNGMVVNTIIDRSFVDEQGTRWIIDFKTSSHEGGGREEFLRSEEQRYRGQLERYAKLMRAYKSKEPIKTALYFPLMGEWREM
jgi:ATP-dependent helicase/nuclease subunit A